MKPNSGKRALEKYKIFPYVAWLLIVAFALFVYQLSIRITVAAQQLQSEQIKTKETFLNFEDLQPSSTAAQNETQ